MVILIFHLTSREGDALIVREKGLLKLRCNLWPMFRWFANHEEERGLSRMFLKLGIVKRI
jgi:hypothetical protein